MKTLVNRKYTTAKAKQQVIDFINSFDFDSYKDIVIVESNHFSILYDKSGNGELHDTAYFRMGRTSFQIATYDSNIGDNFESLKRWDDIYKVFDDTCTYINFKGLVNAMNDFVEKINKAVEEKENEISEFLDFFASWKNRK